jgi:putative ABC transport system ATP-binding protein
MTQRPQPGPYSEARGNAANDQPAVVVDHVTRRYANKGGEAITAVDDLSAHIMSRSVVALTGPSGSGKSSLLHLIGAIDRPDAGTITVHGVELNSLNRRQRADYRRGIGFVFQRFNLLPTLTALENVTAPVMPYRTEFNKHDRGRKLLAAVGLGGRENALPTKLSGGQQQRVAIARALINEPSLLLADEPTGNLDSHTGQQILDLLIRLRDQAGLTVLIATHDADAAAHAERVLRLRDGHLDDTDQ